MKQHHHLPDMLDEPVDTHDPCNADQQECVLNGIGVSPGIAIGSVFLYTRDGFTVEFRRIGEDEIDQETQRFENAVGRAERDLAKIVSVARERLGEGSAAIFDAQRLMLRDSQVFDAVKEHIRRERCNADYAVKSVMTKHRQRMEASENEYLRERANDLLDVQDRLIRHLRRGKLLSAIESETIVVAQSLTAADMVLFSRRRILGCAMDFGGPTSHVSLVARALRVPAVVGLHTITDQIENGDLVILDGMEGHVIIRPTEERLEQYRIRSRRYQRLLQEQKSLVPLPAETLDGHRVALRANLELEEELNLLDEFGATGIGLYRTEIQFLFTRSLAPAEDQLYRQYTRIVKRVSPELTTFRLLDLGGDKMLPLGHREQNPFLGWRGIRILLDRPEMLRAQLRAILRASAHGPLRILLPMVTTLSELDAFKEVFQSVKVELREDGLLFDESIPLGIMIEVPAAALTARQFAPHVDFFSIGTNDLTQYTLAVDRGNDLVADIFQELHPAVLRLIRMTTEAAYEYGIPVSVCGEMAADPRATALLIGLGVDELSTVPSALPEVKRVIRSMVMDEARDLACAALAEQNAQAVRTMVEEWLTTHGCGLFTFLDDPVDADGDA